LHDFHGTKRDFRRAIARDYAPRRCGVQARGTGIIRVADQGERTMSWGALYVAGEWVIRIGALFYVPQRRAPSAARAWLLLIFFLPYVGLVLYSLIGRAFLPRRRMQMQAQIYAALAEVLPDAGGTFGIAGPLAPAAELAARLSEFAVVDGNRFELLPAYDAALERLVAEIDGASRFVHLLYYIFESDDTGAAVSAALERAAGRGVTVRVLMDAIGSRSGLRRLAPRLRGAGVEVTAVLPLRMWGPNRARIDLRNHRKIAVIDGRVAFFGSQNVVSAHANAGLTNEEMMVRATGPVVHQLDALLVADRYLERGDVPPESRTAVVEPHAAAGGTPAQVLPSGPGFNAGTTEDVMIALLYAARRRVVLTTPYFVPSEPFAAAMRSAARRGVEVVLVVDRTSNKPLVQLAQQSFYDDLLAAGVRIRPYSGNFLHAKHMSVDDEMALIGSSNLDLRSFMLNAEVSVLIYDRGIAADLRRIQERYLRDAEAIEPRAWAARSRGRRVLENLARLADAVL
jgi:cardiolipin synthase